MIKQRGKKPQASLPFKGQVTEQTTVKRPIVELFGRGEGGG